MNFTVHQVKTEANSLLIRVGFVSAREGLIFYKRSVWQHRQCCLSCGTLITAIMKRYRFQTCNYPWCLNNTSTLGGKRGGALTNVFLLKHSGHREGASLTDEGTRSASCSWWPVMTLRVSAPLPPTHTDTFISMYLCEVCHHILTKWIFTWLSCVNECLSSICRVSIWNRLKTNWVSCLIRCKLLKWRKELRRFKLVNSLTSCLRSNSES